MDGPRPGGTSFLIKVPSVPGKYALVGAQSHLILSANLGHDGVLTSQSRYKVAFKVKYLNIHLYLENFNSMI